MQMTPEQMYRMRKQFFNDNAENWLDTYYKSVDSGQYDRHQKAFERLSSLVPLKPGDRVLDAGCGSGILVPMLLERITSTGILYELDYAEKMIEANRNLHKENNIVFIVSDASETPLDDASCDVVICFSCFPHFHDKEKSMASLSRVLKNGGLFAIAHFDSSQGISKHHESCHAVMHDHLPDQPEMRKLFHQAGLTIDLFTDEPGFYCVIAQKRVAEMIKNDNSFL
jgi:ubiquinone/menaquinone biosynthesis C-methylase UbiE